MGIKEDLQFMENSPEFAKFSYQQQVDVRERMAAHYLPQNAEFLSFSNEVQLGIIEDLKYRKPVFIVKEGKASWVPQINEFVAEMDSGDPKRESAALERIMATVGSNAVLENLTVTNLLKTVGYSVATMITGETGLLEDHNKAMEYYRYQTQLDKRSADNTNTLMNVFGGVAQLMDTIALYSIGVGSYANPRGITSIAMKGLDWVGRKTKMGNATLKILTAFTHSLGGGIVGTMRETMKDWSLQSASNPVTRNIMVNSLHHFGEYAFWDLAAFGAGGLLKDFAGTALGKTFPILQKLRRVPEILKGGKWSKQTKKLVSGALVPNTMEDIFKYVGDAVNMEVPKIQYDLLSPVGQNVVDQLGIYGRTMRNWEKRTAEDMFMIGALFSNHAVDAGSKGFKVTSLFDEKVLGTYSNINKASQSILDNLQTLGIGKQTALDMATMGAGMQTAQIRELVTGKVFEGVKGNVDVLTRIIAPIGGKLTPQKVTAFTRGYLKSFDLSDGLISSITSKLDGKQIKLSISGNEIAVIPRQIISGINEKKTIETIINSLDNFIPDTAIANRKAMENFIDLYQRSAIKQELFTPTWVEDTATGYYRSFKKIPDGFEVVSKDGIVRQFANLDDVGTDIIKRTTTVESLRQHLDDIEGMSLNEVKNNKLELRKQGLFKEEFESVEHLLTKHPEFTPKISAEFAPIFGVVNDLTDIKYVNRVAMGTYQDILREFDKFKSFSKTVDQIKLYAGPEGTLNVYQAAREFEVYLPEFGYRETFKDHAKAMNFLKTNHDNFSDMFMMANKKGYHLEIVNGKYAAYMKDSDKILFAQNIDEMKAILRDAPIPEHMTELTKANPQILNNLEKPTDFMWKPQEVPVPTTVTPQTKMPAKWDMANLLSPIDRQLNKASKLGFLPDNVMTKYRSNREMVNTMTAANFKMVGALEATFTDVSGRVGKVIKNEKVLENMGALFEIKPIEWTDGLLKEFGLKPKHGIIAKRVKDYMWEMGQVFSVPADIMIGEYLPVLRRFVASGQYKASNFADGEMFKFFRQAMNNDKAALDLTAFFQHERVATVVDGFIREKNPMTLFTKYITAGNREAFLGESLKELVTSMDTALIGKKMPQEVFERLVTYVNEVSGMVKKSPTREAANRAYESFLNSMGFADNVVNKDIVSAITNAGYLANMAFRPWIAVRNTMQISYVGSRIGLSYLVDSAAKMWKDIDGEVYKRLKGLGVLNWGIPVPGGQFLGTGGTFSKFAKNGMKYYKNADEYTRGMAYLASEARFQRAVDYWPVTDKKFYAESGISLMEDDIQRQMRQLLGEGKTDTVKHLFAERITRDSMFDYRPGMGTTIDKGGIVGPLIGQYGHYSTWFRAHIAKGMGQGTAPQRIAFATRTTALGLGLTTAFGAAGIGAMNFLPWAPAIFTGGPFYDVTNKVFDLVGGGWQGDMAARSLFGYRTKDGKPYFDIETLLNSQLFLSIIPTAHQIRSLVRGLQSFNEGNIYEGILNLTSSPIVEPDPWFWIKRTRFLKDIINQ